MICWICRSRPSSVCHLGPRFSEGLGPSDNDDKIVRLVDFKLQQARWLDVTSGWLTQPSLVQADNKPLSSLSLSLSSLIIISHRPSSLSHSHSLILSHSHLSLSHSQFLILILISLSFSFSSQCLITSMTCLSTRLRREQAADWAVPWLLFALCSVLLPGVEAATAAAASQNVWPLGAQWEIQWSPSLQCSLSTVITIASMLTASVITVASLLQQLLKIDHTPQQMIQVHRNGAMLSQSDLLCWLQWWCRLESRTPMTNQTPCPVQFSKLHF